MNAWRTALLACLVGVACSWHFPLISAQEIPAAVIRGTVFGTTESGSEPLAGATVALGGAEVRQGQTDAFGAYRFEELLSGDYTITVTAPGHIGQATGASVPEAGDVVLDFLLEAGSSQVPGDINGDGLVNAIDVQLVINAALGIDISGSVPN